MFWPYLAIFGVPWPTLDFFLAPYEMGCIVLCFGYRLGPKSTIIYLFWDFWRVFPWKTSFLSFLAISVMFEAPVLCLGKTDSAKLLMDGLHMYQWPSRPTIGVKCPLCWNLGHSRVTYAWTKKRTENLPILQDFVPYGGRCPASPHENQGESRAGQGNRWPFDAFGLLIWGCGGGL